MKLLNGTMNSPGYDLYFRLLSDAAQHPSIYAEKTYKSLGNHDIMINRQLRDQEYENHFNNRDYDTVQHQDEVLQADSGND